MTLLLSRFCYSCLENVIILINVLMLVGRNGENWPFPRGYEWGEGRGPEMAISKHFLGIASTHSNETKHSS